MSAAAWEARSLLHDVAEEVAAAQTLKRLENERAKLEAHYAGAIPLDLLKSEQDRIASEHAQAERIVATAEIETTTLTDRLERAFAFLPNAQGAYLAASPTVRRRYNQAFFARLYVDEDYQVASDLALPWDILFHPNLLETRGRGRRTDRIGERTPLRTTPLQRERRPERPLGLSEDYVVDLKGRLSNLGWGDDRPPNPRSP